MVNVCEHGQLKRSCNICEAIEMQKENGKLKTENVKLQAENKVLIEALEKIATSYQEHNCTSINERNCITKAQQASNKVKGEK